MTPTTNFRGTASYTIMRPHVTEVDPAYEGTDRPGDALLRRPTHSGSLNLSYGRAGGFDVSSVISYVGTRPDLDFSQFPSPRVTLPSYTKIDLSAEMPIVHRGFGGFSLTARVENLFDKRYEDVLNFPAPGRAVLIGGRASTAF